MFDILSKYNYYADNKSLPLPSPVIVGMLLYVYAGTDSKLDR